MATGKKEPKAADAQSQMTSFVQTFARPQAPAPALEAPDADEPTPEPEVAAEAAPPSLREEEGGADAQAATGKKPTTLPDENATWAEHYLRPSRVRKTKAIYVDEDTHSALTLITQDAGIGLADLLINIVNVHFDTFRPEIRQFLAEREKLKKKKFPF